MNAETANGSTDDRNLNQYTGGFLLQAEGGQPSACFLLRIRHDDPAIPPRSHEQETPERILNHKPAAEAPRYSDYTHLARVGEWSAVGEGDE